MELIPLVCKQCGGKLETEEDKVFLLGEDSVVIKQGSKLVCQFCQTEHLAGEQVNRFTTGNVSIKIKGNVSGSNFVIGNGNTVVNNTRRKKE